MKFCKTLTVGEKKKTVPVNKNTGMIHSFETFGCLDGPGIRFVVFFEGCPLRCAYCHNRDMLDLKDYMEMTPRELVNVVMEYKPYFGKKGGVTISGGDPVFQPKFLLSFLKLCKKNGINTTLDTSLFLAPKLLDTLIPYADLFMVSLKHFDSETHRCLTGVPNELILANLRHLTAFVRANKGKKGVNVPKLWFRYLILPGYTDTRGNLRALRGFLREMKGVFELVELLPYHTYGVYKWKKLGLKYALEGVKSPSKKSVQDIRKMLEKDGVTVMLNE